MFQKLWQWVKKLYRQWFWRSQNWLNYGDQQRRLGQWETAVSAYNHAIHLETNNCSAWRKKGYILTEMEQYEEALICYEKALRINHNNADIWCEKADILAKLERYQFAISAYGSALEFNPQITSAWIAQGDLFQQIQQEESAVQCYEQALILQPNDQETRQKKDVLVEQINKEKKIANLFTQVEDCYQQKNYQEVVNIYEQILAIKSNYELGWDHQGHALLELGEYDRALQSLDKALEIREDHAEVWYFKGRTLENLGEFTEALISYNQALELDKKYYQAWDGKAIVFSKLQQEEEAKNSWQTAFEINPNYFQGYLNQGLINQAQEKYIEAKNNFDQALKINSDYYHGWLCQARLHADYGRYKQALKIWNQLLEKDNKPIKYLENRSLMNVDLEDEVLNYAIKIYKSLLDKITIYSQQKRELVSELLDKVLKLNPQSAKAWWYKAKGLKYSLDTPRLERDKMRVNYYYKALHYFNKKDPDYKEIYQEHLFVKNHFACELNKDAEEHIKAGEFDEAIEELTEAIEIFSDLKEEQETINSYRLRGHLYSQLGKYQQAINDFNQALLIGSNTHYLTYCERGLTHELLGNIQEAINDYSQAIEIQPSFESYNRRGLLYSQQQDFTSAIRDFDEAINFNPSDANCLYSRGFAKVQLGEKEEAIDDFLQSAELYKMEENIEAYKVVVNAVEQLQNDNGSNS